MYGFSTPKCWLRRTLTNRLLCWSTFCRAVCSVPLELSYIYSSIFYMYINGLQSSLWTLRLCRSLIKENSCPEKALLQVLSVKSWEPVWVLFHDVSWSMSASWTPWLRVMFCGYVCACVYASMVAGSSLNCSCHGSALTAGCRHVEASGSHIMVPTQADKTDLHPHFCC